MPDDIDIIEDGLAYIFYPNRLGTVTIAAIKQEQWQPFQDFIDVIPDDQVVDIAPARDERDKNTTNSTAKRYSNMASTRIRRITAAALHDAVAKVRRKIKREGEYADWDERMKRLGLAD